MITSSKNFCRLEKGGGRGSHRRDSYSLRASKQRKSRHNWIYVSRLVEFFVMPCTKNEKKRGKVYKFLKKGPTNEALKIILVKEFSLKLDSIYKKIRSFLIIYSETALIRRIKKQATGTQSKKHRRAEGGEKGDRLPPKFTDNILRKCI